MLSVYQGRYLSRNPLRTTKAPKELVQESWEFKWRSKSPSWAGDRTSFGLPTQVLNDKGRLLQCSRIVSQKFGRSVSLSRGIFNFGSSRSTRAAFGALFAPPLAVHGDPQCGWDATAFRRGATFLSIEWNSSAERGNACQRARASTGRFPFTGASLP